MRESDSVEYVPKEYVSQDVPLASAEAYERIGWERIAWNGGETITIRKRIIKAGDK